MSDDNCDQMLIHIAELQADVLEVFGEMPRGATLGDGKERIEALEKGIGERFEELYYYLAWIRAELRGRPKEQAQAAE